MEPSFGRWLKLRRRVLDLTQEQLAWEVGCAGETIRKIESGRLVPSKQIAARLAERCGVPADEREHFLQFARARRSEATQPPMLPGSLPAPDPPPPSNNLPAQLTSFVGRQEELALLRELLAREHVRLLTLTGPGGVGKTRLCIELASGLHERFADGIVYVPLAQLSDPALLPAAIATTLGLKVSPMLAPLELLKRELRGRQLLLVLDNLEHLLAAAPLLSELLASLPWLKLLVTSRSALWLYGEFEFVLEPLACPPLAGGAPEQVLSYAAVRLFLQRAEAIDPYLRPADAELPLLAEICNRLDGLPLAIELAAAQVRRFSLGQLVGQLDQRLTLLVDGPRDLADRQRTLWNVIDWSYQLLDPAERRLFARLGVFQGAALDSLDPVCSLELEPPADNLTLLRSLHRKQLVRINERASPARFSMYESIREYALQQLLWAQEEPLLRRRHACYYLELAERGMRLYAGPEQQDLLDLLELEHNNLRAAMSWALESGELDLAARIALGLTRVFWHPCGYLREGLVWLERILAHESELQLMLRARVFDDAAWVANRLGRTSQAIRWMEQSLVLWRSSGDRRGLARALTTQMNIASNHGDHAQALIFIQESLALFRQVGDPSGAAYALINLGHLYSQLDHLAHAGAIFDEALSQFDDLQDRRGLAIAHAHKARLALQQGEPERALMFWGESLPLFISVGIKEGLCFCAEGLGALAELCSQPVWVARWAGLAHAMRQAIGTSIWLSDRDQHERRLASARATLGTAAFEEIWRLAQQSAPTADLRVLYCEFLATWAQAGQVSLLKLRAAS